MKNLEVNPVVATIVVVLVLLVAGGIWYYRATPVMGRPGMGQAGRVDPALSGPNSVFKRNISEQRGRPAPSGSAPTGVPVGR